MELGKALAAAREQSRYSQDDLAAALGVSRVMVSYWETGKRNPSDRQLVALSKLYGIELVDLLAGKPSRSELDVASMFFRTAEQTASPSVRAGLVGFVDFLDTYADLSDATGIPIGGMRQSPFVNRKGFDTNDDARRKAEEVRGHLRLALGPISDLDTVCDMLGIAVVRASLGEDLDAAPSGAFYSHPRVGFAILVNLQMTPGRRRFTLAHELAHALFHSDDSEFVVSGMTRDPRERFADAFAGEFLMPAEAIRRLMEDEGIGTRVTEVEDVLRIQRYFKVSYVTALVRLRQARFITAEDFDAFGKVRPVIMAESLGFDTDPDEYFQDPNRWRVARFPQRFLRMLRHALVDETISVPTAASMTGLTIQEISELLKGSVARGLGPYKKELDEYLAAGVLGES